MLKRGLLLTAIAVLMAGTTQDRATRAQEPDAVPPAQGSAQPDASPAADQDAQTPTFRTGIDFVRVDVIVSDKSGKPVTDLTAEDFIVTEDGKPQTVSSFKLVNVNETNYTTPARAIRTTFDEESEAQREDVRLFAIFLDDYHVRRGASIYVREPLMKFLQTQIAPSDLVAIMYPLTPLSDVVMSRDHESMAAAVQRFDGRKYDYTPRNQFEERYANYPAEIVERVRNEVSLSALRGLITHIGALREGRKAIILVSEGYSLYLPPQMRDPIASMPGFGNPQRQQGGAGMGIGEDRARFYSDVEMADDLRRVYDEANKNNTAIYALDPRGLTSFEYDINEGVGDIRVDSASLRMFQNSLRTLADETDGRAIVNQNDLEKGLRQLVQDSSTYYLVGYNSTQAPQDGKFHEINVRLKRKGLQVRHRKGYWALTPEDVTRALKPAPERPKELDQALATITERPRSQHAPIRTWFGTSRGENGKTRVTFVWEPNPPPPGTKADRPSALTITAVAPDGSPYFRGRVTPGASEGDAVQASAPAPGSNGPGQVVFDAPPGRLQLRYSIEGETSGVLDTDVREYTIPDLTAAQVQLSTPQVLRARSVREFREINAGGPSVPTAGREFRRTDRLLIRFDAYGPADAPSVAARLLNRAGQPMLDLPVSTREDSSYQLDLPLAGMAAAEYLVEITASGEAGQAKQLVAFRVVS